MPLGTELGDPAILVVDDEASARKSLAACLKRLGYGNVIMAEDGAEALDALHDTPFDLMLLDIGLPGISGYEVLERMREEPVAANVPVIVISGEAEPDGVSRCLELGAVDRLPKPFEVSVLKSRIGACLDLRRQHHAELDYRHRIEGEIQRSDMILRALLPAAAVDELMAGQPLVPRRVNNVVVLFCDLVGFTAYCDSADPEEAVHKLDHWMSVAEDIVERHGLEKIKTVGDGFLATAGLLTPNDRPVLSGLRCGLDMVAAAGAAVPGWQVHVGIHCGPVVAGAMGRRAFSFDIWGDTVNTAARIAQHAQPGTVLVSGAVWGSPEARCCGKALGKVELKGKGRFKLYRCDAVESAGG